MMDSLLRNPDFLSVLCGAGAFAVVVLVWTALVDSDPLTTRMKAVTDRRDELRSQNQNKKKSRLQEENRADFVRNLVQKLKLEQGKQINDIRVKLARAGFRSRDAIMNYLALRLLLPLGLGLFMAFMIFGLGAYNLHGPMKFVGVAAAVLFGLALPDIFLKNQMQKRETMLRKGFPDALDLMVICAEAGLSLDAALDRVSREIAQASPILAEEVGLTGIELGFLPERSKALQNLAERVPLPGVISLVNTLIQTERYGTPLAQALRVLSAEMRNERMMAAEAKAAKLPATLTVPMILFILPPLFIILIGPAIIKVSKIMQ